MARKAAKQVGALWRREKQAEEGGEKQVFLTGVIDLGIHGEIPIAVFKNDNKKDGSKQPDFRIVLSRPAEGDKPGSEGGEGGDGLPF